MKRIGIEDYWVPAPEISKTIIEHMIGRGWTPPAKREKGDTITIRYSVKDSLLVMLFHPDLRIQAKELLDRDKLAHRLDECKEKFILLEETEYSMIKRAVDTISGYGRNDVELVRRVLDAETVEVQEKSKREER